MLLTSEHASGKTLSFDQSLKGLHGELVVQVDTIGESQFRNAISQVTPIACGEQVVLGRGMVFFEDGQDLGPREEQLTAGRPESQETPRTR